MRNLLLALRNETRVSWTLSFLGPFQWRLFWASPLSLMIVTVGNRISNPCFVGGLWPEDHLFNSRFCDVNGVSRDRLVSRDGTIPWMEKIHFASARIRIKPYKSQDEPPINWCALWIWSIHSTATNPSTNSLMSCFNKRRGLQSVRDFSQFLLLSLLRSVPFLSSPSLKPHQPKPTKRNPRSPDFLPNQLDGETSSDGPRRALSGRQGLLEQFELFSPGSPGKTGPAGCFGPC